MPSTAERGPGPGGCCRLCGRQASQLVCGWPSGARAMWCSVLTVASTRSPPTTLA